MTIDQETLIAKTQKIISPFNLVRTMVMIVIYVVVVILFFVLLRVDLDPLVIGLIVIILTAYFISKDFLLSRQTGSIMRTHKAFLVAKHGDDILYLPLLGRSGGLFHLKQAALFFQAQELFIEVFASRSMKQGPLTGVTVKNGEDFILIEDKPDPKLALRAIKSQIKGQDFAFYIIDEALLGPYMTPVENSLDKEVT